MRDEFVMVKSEDELRPGMCVELRPCVWCGKRDRFILARQGKTEGRYVGPDGFASRTSMKWEFDAAGKCYDQSPIVFEYAIRERRLYRLIDDDMAADETATTKRRTKEVAR